MERQRSTHVLHSYLFQRQLPGRHRTLSARFPGQGLGPHHEPRKRQGAAGDPRGDADPRAEADAQRLRQPAGCQHPRRLPVGGAVRERGGSGSRLPRIGNGRPRLNPKTAHGLQPVCDAIDRPLWHALGVHGVVPSLAKNAKQ